MADNNNTALDLQEEMEQAGIGYAPVNAIEAITRGEVDIQISTAHAYPRSLEIFLKRAKGMIGIDIDTAESCIYRLPRKNKSGQTEFIEGESIRLAEIVAVSYGNLRAGGRVISVEDKFVVAQGAVHDLETNVAYSFENRRGIITSRGVRYSNDMILMTCNAAISIALRNSVFRVVPKALIKPLYDYAKKVAVGDETTLPDRRKRALAFFLSVGVSQDQVLTLIEKKGIEDIDLLDIERLAGLKTAIKDGETKVADVFGQSSTAAPANTVKMFAAPVKNTNGEGPKTIVAPTPAGNGTTSPEPPQTTVPVEEVKEIKETKVSPEDRAMSRASASTPPPSMPENTVTVEGGHE